MARGEASTREGQGGRHRRGVAHAAGSLGRRGGEVYGGRMPRQVLALVISTLVLGCGESRQDVYTAGMKVEGDAERGPCKLIYDKKEGANILTGDQVQACLKMQGEAVALYERAAALGLKSVDFVRTHEEAKRRFKRLEGMLKMVREMEMPEYKAPVLPDEPK